MCLLPATNIAMGGGRGALAVKGNSFHKEMPRLTQTHLSQRVLSAIVGKDSNKAKFPQSPLGEIFWKLHRNFIGWLNLFVS